MRIVRLKGTLVDGSCPCSAKPQDHITQRPWQIDLIDWATFEPVRRVQHATIEIDADGTIQGTLTFADRTTEVVHILVG